MSPNKTAPQPTITPMKNFIAGGFGGMCLVMAGHPFDTIKVRLQTTSATGTVVGSKLSSPTVYTGAFDCFKKTFVNEGILGFYKGMGTPLAMVTPLFALGFFGYGMGKTVITKLSPVSPNHKGPVVLSPLQLFGAGALSACITTFVVTPVERIKCLLQIQVQSGTSATGSPKYKGPIHCASTLLKEGGIPSLYRGFGSTIIRGIPQTGLYFMTYEVLKRKMGGEGALSPAKTLLAGGLTGVINWSLVLPFDVVKSRIQTAPKEQFPRGFRDAFPQLLRAEGVKGLYRGFVPVFIRAFPANAACFMGFETAIKFMNFVGV